MKKVFLVKKNPDLPSAEDNWIIMNAYEFAMFMKTEEGKKRMPNFGRLLGCKPDDEIIFAECGEKTARTWRSQENRSNYLMQYRSESGYTVFSYNAIKEEDDEDLTGEDLLEDKNINVEETALLRVLKENLHTAILSLSPEDQDLVMQIFLSKHPMTEKSYAESIGTTRDQVHERKRTVLRRLKTILGGD